MQTKNKNKNKKSYWKKKSIKILVALGLTIGEFIHEIKQFQGALSADIENIKKLLSNEDELIVISRLDKNIQNIGGAFVHFV